ncbi:MAG: hypothetical protein ACKV22_39775 [Bryobacteraceae bacterium]
MRWVLIAALLGALPIESAIRIVTRTLPRAVVQRGYQTRLEAVSTTACPNSDIQFSAEGLPEGLRLSPVGEIQGVVRRTGRYPLVVRASNSCSAAREEFTIRVLPAALFEIRPRDLVFRMRQGAAAARQSFAVRATWPEISYRIDIEPQKSPWLRISPQFGEVPPDGSPLDGDAVHVEIDGAALQPGVYRAALLVSAAEALRTEKVTVTVYVSSAQ